MTSPEDTAQLVDLLEKRLSVIGDHEWRDRDEEGHLAALIEAGEALEAWKRDHLAETPPRLRHFLEGCSYDKALAFAQESLS